MIINNYKINLENDEILKKFKDYTVISIETTGLSKYKDIIISYSTLEIKKESDLKVYTAQSLEEEIDLVNKIDLKNKNIISYNLDGFTLPFIEEKFKFYKKTIPSFEAFDIYKYLKKNSDFLNIENYRQKTVEEFLKIKNDEEIKSKNIGKYFKNYLLSKYEDNLDKIIKHNKDNTLNIYKILEIYKYIEELKTLKILNHNFYIDNLSFSDTLLLVNGKNYLDFDCEFNTSNYSFSSRNNKFTIEINYLEDYYDDQNKCKYLIANNFFNMKMQDEIEAPENIYILYYKKTLINNTLHLIKTIVEESLNNI